MEDITGNNEDLQALREKAVEQENPEQMSVGDMVEMYASLRNDLSVERKKFQEIEQDIKGEMEKLEAQILERQRSLGVKSLSTENYTAYQTEKTFVRMGDWDTFSDWVLKTGNIQCLEKRCAKLACLEVFEEETNKLRKSSGLSPEDNKYESITFNMADIGIEKTQEIAIQIRKK